MIVTPFESFTMNSIDQSITRHFETRTNKPVAPVSDHMQLTSAMRRLESMWSKQRVSRISKTHVDNEPPLKYAVNPNVGREAWTLATIALIAKDAVVGVADLPKLSKWASRRILNYFVKANSDNFFTYAPRCFKGSAVAEGFKKSIMVPVETYIDDDEKFVADTVNSEDFLVFVSALFKDADMARMMQDAPALRPDARKDLDAYYTARNDLKKKHSKHPEGRLYKKELKEVSYPAIIFEDDRVNESYDLIARKLLCPEYQLMFGRLYEQCSTKFQTGEFTAGARCAPATSP